MKTYMSCLAIAVLSACAGSATSGQSNVGATRLELDLRGGTDVTDNFLKTHLGTFQEPDWKETFTFNADRSLIREQTRQVGRDDNPTVPYETLCSYREIGHLEGVIERSKEDRANYMDFATHIIVYSVDRVELIASPKNSANCAAFIAQENQYAQRGLQYSDYAELLAPDQFRVHTSGGGDYVQGGPRTPSTLDEVYTKVTEKN